MQHRNIVSKFWHKHILQSEYYKVKRKLSLLHVQQPKEKTMPQRESFGIEQTDPADEIQENLNAKFGSFFFAGLSYVFDVKDDVNVNGTIQNLSFEEALDLRIIIEIYRLNKDNYEKCITEIKKYLLGNTTVAEVLPVEKSALSKNLKERCFKTGMFGHSKLNETLTAIIDCFDKLVVQPQLPKQTHEYKKWALTFSYQDDLNAYQDHLNMAFTKHNERLIKEGKTAYDDKYRAKAITQPENQIFLKSSNKPADLIEVYNDATKKFINDRGNCRTYKRSLKVKCWMPESKEFKGVILLVHGEDETVEIWNRYAQSACAQGYKVIAHQQSYSDFDMNRCQLEFQKVFARIAKENKGMPIHLAGHHLGASVLINSLSFLEERKSSGSKVETVSLFSPALLKGPKITGFNPFRFLSNPNAFPEILPQKKPPKTEHSFCKWWKLFDVMSQTFKTFSRYLHTNLNRSIPVHFYAGKGDIVPGPSRENFTVHIRSDKDQISFEDGSPLVKMLPPLRK